MRLQGTCSGRAAQHDPWPFPTTPGSRPPTIELDCGKVSLGCKATSGRAARLQGCRATGLQGYRAAHLRDLLHVGLVQDISLWITLRLPFVCVQWVRGKAEEALEEALDAVPSHGQGFATLVMGELDLELGVLM